MTSKNDINNALIHDQLFFADISELLRSGRETAYRSVNSVMIKTYWQIGKRIVEQEQHGKARANYGEQLIVHLSRYLTDCFGKGFSVANLKNIRQFYQTFTVLDELATQCVANLSWSHLRLIMRLDDTKERTYYLQFESCSLCRRPTYCVMVPFHEMGKVKNNVSNLASSNPSPINLPVASNTRS